MKQRLFFWGGVALFVATGIAGCGHHSSAPAHHTQHHHRRATPSTSPSATTTPTSSPSTPSTPSTTSVPVSQNASNASPSVSQVSGGGVGGTDNLRARVQSVTAEGRVSVNGATDNLYLVRLSLQNMTTSVVPFALNDVWVYPSGTKAGPSRNDYSLKGITQQNSLFPYPIVPQHASAVQVMIQSDQTVTGDFTVEVPQATRYAVQISGRSGPIAIFTE